MPLGSAANCFSGRRTTSGIGSRTDVFNASRLLTAAALNLRLFKGAFNALARFYKEKQPLSDDTDLEEKTIEALRQYRKALARVETLEQEEASAHRALASMLPDLGRAILEDDTPSLKGRVFETGSAAVSRSNETWSALSEATATLEVARQALVVLEQQLGYIPDAPMAADSRAIRPSPNGGY